MKVAQNYDIQSLANTMQTLWKLNHIQRITLKCIAKNLIVKENIS